MKVKKATKLAWECENCGFITDEPEELEVWLVPTDDEELYREGDGGTVGYLLVDPSMLEKEDRVQCTSCGGVFEEIPHPEAAWMCGECEEIYEDRDDAKECCK